MKFSYGSYTHVDNSVQFTGIQKSLILGQNQRPHMERWTWSLKGRLLSTGSGDPQPDILSQYNTLLNAYSVNGQSCGFAGTPFFIVSSNTIGGTFVTAPVTHEQLGGAEMVTFLNYSFAIQADFPYAEAGTVLAYSETMSFTDNNGAPIYIERLPQNGPPILQQVTSNSWYYGEQSGSITTAFANSNWNPPLFPALIQTSGNAGRNITFNSPQMVRGVPVSYTTTWRYKYISPVPFFSYPNIVG